MCVCPHILIVARACWWQEGGIGSGRPGRRPGHQRPLADLICWVRKAEEACLCGPGFLPPSIKTRDDDDAVRLTSAFSSGLPFCQCVSWKWHPEPPSPSFPFPHLDRDVKEVVGDHLRRLRRAPPVPVGVGARPSSSPRSCPLRPPLLRSLPLLAVAAAAYVWVHQLHVVQPGQKVVQETLGDGRARRLKAVADFWEKKKNKKWRKVWAETTKRIFSIFPWKVSLAWNNVLLPEAHVSHHSSPSKDNQIPCLGQLSRHGMSCHVLCKFTHLRTLAW